MPRWIARGRGTLASANCCVGAKQKAWPLGCKPRKLRHSGPDSETDFGRGFRAPERSRISPFPFVLLKGLGIRDRFGARNPRPISVSESGPAHLPQPVTVGLPEGDPHVHLRRRSCQSDPELAIVSSPTKPPLPCLFYCLRLDRLDHL